MRHRYTRAWMLAEAVELIQSADRMQRQFFQVGQAGQSPFWEPPVDIYEHGDKLSLLIALPGVAPGRFAIVLEPQTLVVRGERSLGAPSGPGTILRLEIPYGRFERRIHLPDGGFRLSELRHENGCLKLTLERLS